MDFKVIKEKEQYRLYNNGTIPLFINIILKGCNQEELPILTNNIEANSSFLFIPEKDGEYIVTYSLLEEDKQIIISHYPSILKAIVKNLTDLLGTCHTNTPCLSKNQVISLKTQTVFNDILLLFGLTRSIVYCETNYNVLYEALYNSLSFYNCNLFSLFCNKELDLKIQGTSPYNNEITVKIISIIFLILYFYEREISNPDVEFVNFLNEKYNIKELKDYILKKGIDIVQVDNEFSAIYFDKCQEVVSCDLNSFSSITPYFEKSYTFDINQELNSIYDTIILKNTSGKSQYFFNFVLYKDNDFKVALKAISSTNPTIVAPGQEIEVTTSFIGKKAVYTLLPISYMLDGTLLGKYSILFKESIDIVNTPPVISNINKVLDNRQSYPFTIEDFENHFVDADGDTLKAIILVGDTSRYTLNGIPYIAGTIINRNNIENLIYTPLDTDTEYEVIVYWIGIDSRDAQSQ